MITKRTQWQLLALIIVGGFGLRLIGLYWGQGYARNSIGDELEAYKVGRQFLAGDQQALYLGQPNFKHGKIPGMLWAMLWAAEVRLGGGPSTMMLTFVLLNTAVIWLTFVLGQRLFDPVHGLWAALLLATSPWPVYFSVGCTNPEILAFFGVCLYLALWTVVRESNSPHIFWVVLVLAIMPQFHMFAVFLLPPVLLLLLLRRNELHRQWLGTGLAVALLFYVPYFVGEAQHHWANTRRIYSHGDEFSFGSLKVLSTTVMSLTNLIASAVGNRLTQYADYQTFGNAVCGSFSVLVAFNALSIGLGTLALGNFVLRLSRALRGKWRTLPLALASAPATVFVGVLIVLPLLLFIPTGASFNSRYVIALYPLLFLLPAVLLATTRYRRLIRAGVVTTIAFNLWLCLAFFHDSRPPHCPRGLLHPQLSTFRVDVSRYLRRCRAAHSTTADCHRFSSPER